MTEVIKHQAMHRINPYIPSGQCATCDYYGHSGRNTYGRHRGPDAVATFIGNNDHSQVTPARPKAAAVVQMTRVRDWRARSVPTSRIPRKPIGRTERWAVGVERGSVDVSELRGLGPWMGSLSVEVAPGI